MEEVFFLYLLCQQGEELVDQLKSMLCGKLDEIGRGEKVLLVVRIVVTESALTWDVERGAPNEMVDEPWQTYNCIGGWHYNISIYERNQYKSAASVVRQLVNIVRKNGNLLLSVPLRNEE